MTEDIPTQLHRAIAAERTAYADRHSHIFATLTENSSDVWGAQFVQSLKRLELVGSDSELWQRSVI